ncbi:uncharacterized protein EV422DRAFT_524235 [Fimicolochytrium jonesii]|uniref:uncharacterized protein n=1 Tax=Fimicolochytrium jonesii TaxID=1396493 RepID=UPI0022FE516F|nr:uncharacterized protein EV422DRAFT_524235 [Fimicolochytrium jonesii]KAI8822499.1 hypothetical protein EV422DRAFT_524235 [Fimicolochytrium jonesii]
MDYVQAETLDEVKVEDAQAGTLGGVKAGDMPPANRKRPLEDPADGKVGPSNTAGIRDTTASSTSPSKKQKLGTKAKQVDTAAVAASAIMEASASDASEPRRHKRLAQHPATRANDIYVSRKSNFKALIIYAQKLIDGNSFTTLTIHGLGAALQSAMRLALCLKEHNKGKISWVITTSTVQLVDDVEEEDVDEELKTEKRSNSAIHIELHKVTEASSAISPDSLPVTQ